MTNLKVRLASGLATAALLASSFAPAAFADTNVVVRHNGFGSDNFVKVKNKNKTKVYQYNKTKVVNWTGVHQNTGHNDANGNTGDGSVDVKSGNTTSNVTNNTTTGGNTADLGGCGCPQGDTTVRIVDNGAWSDNTVIVSNSNKTKVSQSNQTFVLNGTDVSQNTGGNDANWNTGGGDVDVQSGNATSTVNNTVNTGSNSVTL